MINCKNCKNCSVKGWCTAEGDRFKLRIFIKDECACYEPKKKLEM